MAVEQAPGGGGVGRRILAEERQGEVFFSWAAWHPGVPVPPGAFNVFVVKLSVGESQHSSQ